VSECDKGASIEITLDTVELDNIVTDETHNAMWNEVMDWMMKDERCYCKYRPADEGRKLRGIKFTCDQEKTKHNFKMKKPFSKPKFTFFMTNDLYAVQKNSPVKRLEWIDNEPDWKKVEIVGNDETENSIITCNQVEPFYTAPGIVERAPFNLIGCLEKSSELYRLVVYKTEMKVKVESSQYRTVQWKKVRSQKLDEKLKTDTLKLTVRSDSLENCFKFYLFTDSSDNYIPHLLRLNYTGNLLEFLKAEFNNSCVNHTTDNREERSSIAKNTHLCTKTIALQNEIIPITTDHGFITYNYTNSLFSTSFTKFASQLLKLLDGSTLTAYHRYHLKEINGESTREKIKYVLEPPLSNNYSDPCELKQCERGYVCTNSEYWCYAGGWKHRVYRWFDDLYSKNCRNIVLRCNEQKLIMNEATKKISIEDCVETYNKQKNNNNSACIMNALEGCTVWKNGKKA